MKTNGRASSHCTLKSYDPKRGSARSAFIVRALLALVFFSTLLPTPHSIVPNRVMADPGDLVPGFGTNGIVLTDFAGGNDSANAVATDLLGRIIAAGSATIPGTGTDFALACYDENGNLDLNFGTGGKVTTDFFGANEGVRGVAVQEDNKIVVSGFATNGAERQFALARYLPDGTLDTTFDQDGKVVLDLGSTSEAFKVAVQEDGKIMAVGDSRPQNSLDFTIVRLNPDGSTDNLFGSNGVARVDFGNSDRAIDLAIDEQNIFVAGFAVKSSTDSNFGIIRLNLSNGSLNTAFDGDGKLEIDFFGKQDGAQAIFIRQPIAPVTEPYLIVGGIAINTTAEDFGVAAVDFRGNLIPSLFNQGKDTVDFNGGRDLLFDLIDQPDADIVAAGWAANGSNFDSALAKWFRQDLPIMYGTPLEITTDTASGGNNVAFDGMIYGARIIAVGTGINPITQNDDFTITLHENEKFVEFTKTVDPNPAVEGELITYTFTIKNLTDEAIQVSIGDTLPDGVTFNSAIEPFWKVDSALSNYVGSTFVFSKRFTVRSMLTETVKLIVRADKFGSKNNKAQLQKNRLEDGIISIGFLGEAEVDHFIVRAEVTGAARNGKNLNVTMNSTGATQSGGIAPNGFEPQASCPVVLFDGVEQKTRLDADNPSTTLIVKKGYKRLTPGQPVRIRVRLCNGTETDDFIYTRPQ